MNTDTKVRSFRDLLVWQEGLQLAKSIYTLTRQFPEEEKFGLISQMRRAAVSVPSNIAEGQARQSTAEFLQFLAIAQGSLAELQTQLLLSAELGFCPATATAPLLATIERLQKMLHGLRNKLRHPSPPTTNH